MSIASEITRISGNIADAYTSLGAKGATLPASGSQNSANLADTIDTITTGGGGGEDFSSFDSMVEEVANGLQNYSDFKYSTCYAQGWKMTEEKQTSTSNAVSFADTTGVMGFVFYDNVPTLYISSTQVFKVPTGVTIDATNSNYVKVTYPENSDKWLLFLRYNPQKFGDVADKFGIESTISNGYGAGRHVLNNYTKHLYMAIGTHIYTQSSPKTESYNNHLYPICGELGMFSNLISFGFSNNFKLNITSSLSSTGDLLAFCLLPNAMSKSDFFDRSVNDVSYQETALDTTTSVSLVNDYTNKYVLLGVEDIPFILDLSSSAATGSWKLGYIDGWESSSSQLNGSRYLCKTKIKLPPSKNIYLDSFGNRFVEPTYMQYMADNAPSSSSKTIHMGSTMYNYYSENYPTIISTFTSKGWTVSA